MAHEYTDTGDAVLDKEYPILDKGYVRLVDYMGGDSSVVRAARVSYGGGTKKQRGDAKLIQYLMQHRHTSPFEHVTFTFHIKCPIFIARQWMRSRTGSFNEISGRYSIIEEEAYLPEEEQLFVQDPVKKQARGNILVKDPEHIRGIMEREQDEIFSVYNYWYINECNLAREVARINLPLSTYTQFYWTVNLHNILHFIHLRTNLEAQWEIQQYANMLLDIVHEICPLSVAAFRDCVMDAVTFTKTEWKEFVDTLDEKPEVSTGLITPTDVKNIHNEE